MTNAAYNEKLRQVKKNGAKLCDVAGSNHFPLETYKLCTLEILSDTEDKEVVVTGPVLYSSCSAFTIEGAYRRLKSDIIEDFEGEATILDVVKKSDSIMFIVVGVENSGRSMEINEWAIINEKIYNDMYTHTITLD